jgi:hypothetical protein
LVTGTFSKETTMTTMRIFEIGGGKFALGVEGKKAELVLRVTKSGKAKGVRGRRHMLTKGLYPYAKVTPELKAAFKAAIDAV